MIPVTREQILSIAPRAKEVYLAAFDLAGTTLAKYAINETALRVAHFVSQTAHETGGFTIFVESMTYTTADRIMQVFGVGHHSAAVTASEAEGLVRQPELLAERVYGLGNPKKAKELGNTEPGDGFKYIGHGPTQLTGKGSYAAASKRFGVDFVGNPALTLDPRYTLAIAADEWEIEKHCNALADQDDALAITKRINGGTEGLDSRMEWLAKTKKVWVAAV
jgi:putative chitinase